MMNINSLRNLFSKENLTHVEAWVAILALISGIAIASIQINETRELSRISRAVDYCNMYQSNSEIVRFSTETFNVSKNIEEINEYNDLFKIGKDPKDIKEMRCKLSGSSEKINIKDKDMLPFYRLANYYLNAILGVDGKIYDKGTIMSCLASQMICFREKYAIRTDLLNFNDDEIKKIREFIINENNVEKDFMKNCKIATKYFWGQEEEYQSLLTCPKS